MDRIQDEILTRINKITEVKQSNDKTQELLEIARQSFITEGYITASFHCGKIGDRLFEVLMKCMKRITETRLNKGELKWKS